jgi:hypothetical protein
MRWYESVVFGVVCTCVFVIVGAQTESLSRPPCPKHGTLCQPEQPAIERFEPHTTSS